MGKIILLEEVLDEVREQAVSSEDSQFVLFGRRNLVRMKGAEYDFLFHAIEGVKFGILEHVYFFAVPLLPYGTDVESVELLLAEIHKGNPLLTTFAAWNKGVHVYEDLEEKERQLGLSSERVPAFYDLAPAKLGMKVSKRDYTLASQKEFKVHVPGWEKIWEQILGTKKKINEKYAP